MTDRDFGAAGQPNTAVDELPYSPAAAALLSQICLALPVVARQLGPENVALLMDLPSRIRRGESITPGQSYQLISGIQGFDEFMALRIGLELRLDRLGVGLNGPRGLICCLDLLNTAFPRQRIALEGDTVTNRLANPQGPGPGKIFLLMAMGCVVAIARELFGQDSILRVQVDVEEGQIDLARLTQELGVPVSIGTPTSIFLTRLKGFEFPRQTAETGDIGDELKDRIRSQTRAMRVFGDFLLSCLLTSDCGLDAPQQARLLAAKSRLVDIGKRQSLLGFSQDLATILGQGEFPLAMLRASLMVTPGALGYYWPSAGQVPSKVGLQIIEAMAHLMFPMQTLTTGEGSIVVAAREGRVVTTIAQVMLVGSMIGLLRSTISPSVVTRVTLNWDCSETHARDVGRILGVPVELAEATEVFLDRDALVASPATADTPVADPEKNARYGAANEAYVNIMAQFMELAYESDASFDAPSRRSFDEILHLLRQGRQVGLAEFQLRALEFTPPGTELVLLGAGLMLRPYRLGVALSRDGDKLNELKRCVEVYAEGFPLQAVHWEGDKLVFLPRFSDDKPIFMASVIALFSGCLGLTKYLLEDSAISHAQVEWQVSDEFVEQAASISGVPFKRGSVSAIFLNLPGD